MLAKTLLDELLKKRLIKEDAYNELLRDAQLSGKPVEDIIYEKQLVSGKDIAETKSALLGVPYKKINPNEITEDILNLIPEETAQSYKFIPISKNRNMIVVGMLYPDDEKAKESLKFVAKQLKSDMGVYLIARDDFDAVLRKYNPYSNEVEAALRFFKPSKEAAPQRKIVVLEEAAKAVEDAPVIKIVASTLREAVVRSASDVHIEPQKNRLRIRFRIDGQLEEISSLPIELHQPIISRVKIMSELLIDENRKPQDGRFRTIILGRDIDFRVATFPTPAGEKAALRVLDPTVGLKGLQELGVRGPNLKLLQEGIGKPYGMILMTGPTGSGKTTTLYALMQVLNKINVNIVSLEDPVEYFIEGLNQSQVRPDIGYDFASGLRQILRQDPDVIMIGEIRDSETAKLAVHAALTGHIVLSTLHTNNALGVIPRLIDMGVDAFLLPSALNIMAAQRLMQKICPDCKEPSNPSAEIEAIIKRELGNISQAAQSDVKLPYKIYHGKGCKTCKGKGFLGRVAIFEIFQMTRELADIISREPKESAILAEAKRQGMLTLRQDGILKAIDGIVTIEDVLRETEEI